MNVHRLIFLNIGWMDRYAGLDADQISGGGKYVQKHGYGHEIYNFKAYRGKYYGYGRPANDSIAVYRLGAAPDHDYVDNVTVIWIARSVVVGWYKHARVYSEWQSPPASSGRFYKSDEIGYYAVASESYLLPKDARTLRVPRGPGVKYGMGRFVWYPDDTHHKAFIKQLSRVMETKGAFHPVKPHRNGGGNGWQVDSKTRKKIEDAAMSMTAHQYEKWGYRVRPVPEKHLGWDIEAERNGTSLLLEVKGVSGGDTCVELTPNEYTHLKKDRDRYRVCVVTNALSSAKKRLSAFTYDNEWKRWYDQRHAALNIEELTAARLSV